VDNKPVTSPSRIRLYEKLGYDSKCLLHAVRILMVGEHLINTGEFKVNWSDKRDYFLGIKHGLIKREEALNSALLIKSNLDKVVEKIDKSKSLDLFEYIDDLVIKITKSFWKDI
jgi:hypothetical protein